MWGALAWLWLQRPHWLVGAVLGAWCVQGFSHALEGFAAMMSV